MTPAAPAARGPKGNTMQENTLSGLAAGLPGYQATPALPTAPPPPAATDAATTFLLTQVWQQGMQLRTDMAVMQTTVAAIKAETAGISHDLGARVKELEQARLSEVAQMGGMRADFATQVAQAIIQSQNMATQQSQVHSQNQAQWGSQIGSAVIAGGLVLVGIIVNLIIVLITLHH